MAAGVSDGATAGVADGAADGAVAAEGVVTGEAVAFGVETVVGAGVEAAWVACGAGVEPLQPAMTTTVARTRAPSRAMVVHLCPRISFGARPTASRG